MNNKYNFTSAKELLRFIDKFYQTIRTKKLISIYSDIPYTPNDTLTYFCDNSNDTDSPIVLVFEQFSVIFEYYWEGNIDITVVDTNDFYKDPSLNFLYKNNQESSKVSYFIRKINDKLYSNILIEQIDLECNLEEDDSFSSIIFHLSNKLSFSISGSTELGDGYMHISF